jgi:hypothetical protein
VCQDESSLVACMSTRLIKHKNAQRILEVTCSVSRNEKHLGNNHHDTDSVQQNLSFLSAQSTFVVFSKGKKRKLAGPVKNTLTSIRWGRPTEIAVLILTSRARSVLISSSLSLSPLHDSSQPRSTVREAVRRAESATEVARERPHP